MQRNDVETWSSQVDFATADNSMMADFDRANTRRVLLQETHISTWTLPSDGERKPDCGRFSHGKQLEE